MNIKFRENLKDILPSTTLALNSKVNELKKQGINVISFTVGQPDFNTPEYIKQAGIKAIEENFTKYTSAIGIKELKEAIQYRIKKDYNIEYSIENIAISNGAKHSISNLLYVLLNKGDKVIIPSPYWISYPAMVKLMDGEPIFIETKLENEYKISPEQLEECCKKYSPKLLILNTPSNPTGTVYTKEDLEKLVPIIKKYNILVICDDIYYKLTYDNKFYSLTQFQEIRSQTILVNGVSKTYSMTGWRIGYMLGDKEIIKAVAKFQSHFTGNPSSISQKASIEALLNDSEEINKMKNSFIKRRDLAYNFIKDIPKIKCNYPQGAFYLFPNISYYLGKRYKNNIIKNSTDLSNYLLEVHKVAVVPGKDFGNDNHIRISYAISEDDIKEGINRIKKGLLALS